MACFCGRNPSISPKAIKILEQQEKKIRSLFEDDSVYLPGILQQRTEEPHLVRSSSGSGQQQQGDQVSAPSNEQKQQQPLQRRQSSGSSTQMGTPPPPPSLAALTRVSKSMGTASSSSFSSTGAPLLPPSVDGRRLDMYLVSPQGDLVYHSQPLILLNADATPDDMKQMIGNMRNSVVKFSSSLNKQVSKRIKSLHVKGANHLFSIYTFDENPFSIAFFIRFDSKYEVQGLDTSAVDARMEESLLELRAVLEGVIKSSS